MNVSLHAQADANVEVYKFYGGVIPGVTFLALVLQAFLNKYGSWSAFLELPLLVTVYFALSRRNPATGLLLGTVIGLLQDSISHVPLGVFGIAKTCVGYLASSIGGRIDTEHPLARAILVFIFFHVQQVVLTVIERGLLNHSERYFSLKLLAGSAICVVGGLLLFPMLDRLRRPE